MDTSVLLILLTCAHFVISYSGVLKVSELGMERDSVSISLSNISAVILPEFHMGLTESLAEVLVTSVIIKSPFWKKYI